MLSYPFLILENLSNGIPFTMNSVCRLELVDHAKKMNECWYYTPLVLYPYLYNAEKVVSMSVDFQLNEACIPQARQNP